MRIIAGKYRRRKLLTNPGLTTRPMIDRAKVMLFDRIRDRLPNARVADFFCGTGTLGLESLSRGAKSVVFAERDHRAQELLRQNVALLGATDDSLCWRVDLARCSFKPKGERLWHPYDVIFFDPPYATAESIQAGDTWYRCLQQMARPSVSNAGCLLVLRTSREAQPILPPGWERFEEHEMASMRIILANRSDLPVEEELTSIEEEPPSEVEEPSATADRNDVATSGNPDGTAPSA